MHMEWGCNGGFQPCRYLNFSKSEVTWAFIVLSEIERSLTYLSGSSFPT